VTYQSSYDIYINTPDPNLKSPIPQPPSWPTQIPFNVVGCKVCGSSVTIEGSSDTSNAQKTPQVGVDGSTYTSNVGTISCPNGATSVTDVTASVLNDQLALWKEDGPNQGWTISNFQPSSPCTGSNPTSSSPVCILSKNASGPYTFDLIANSCTTQPKGSGKLTVSP
jgi:hypothetical protein